MAPRRLTELEWVALAICPRACVARSAWVRLIGLAWLDREEVPGGWGLLIPRCRSVHTFGMRFALDVWFLDVDGRVVRRVEAVPPRRVLWCRGAAAVVERPARDAALDLRS
jgi:uncharacterized membrane protein (UPF0127 family)